MKCMVYLEEYLLHFWRAKKIPLDAKRDCDPIVFVAPDWVPGQDVQSLDRLDRDKQTKE